MTTHNAELQLKAAISLPGEASEQTSDIQAIRTARQQAETAGEDTLSGAWESLKAQGSFYSAIGSLRSQLDQAVALTEEAERLDPNVTVRDDEEGVELTVLSVKANARFQHGLLSLANDQMGDARRYFEESLGLLPTPAGQLFLAHAITLQGYRQEAINAFQRVVEMDRESEEAIQATRELASLRSVRPKSKKVALWLAVLVGFYDVDRFYLGDIRNGLLKFITGGALGVWWVLDIIRIATNSLRDGNGMKLE